ncbi:ImmA/IrrE family metallo-endopeptidase [Clostridium guangxiense]|uniref:ImmA/IrrE family metallo-endopeptidase n=1 Tax=Clostridium guangxiense TaxID=1662055 RepID=UPI001E36212D|nr:ImmA/IrrE family metallo-endopeptidase [Clostridium guangxiense]MCD2347235.1 ImmA/IrrE family metallo-endopeptidase [Clostridium guangxiense]
MSANKNILGTLEKEEIEDVQRIVNSKLGEYKKTNQIIKEDIFKILEMNCKVIYYPIEDDEICGFVYNFKNHKFVYINSYIPYEKQIFTAAHELYHIWYSDIRAGELLKSVVLEETINFRDIKIEDLKANRFGAEFLVPKDVLLNELQIRKIGKNLIGLREIIELMDVFLVPYKTLVRRLYEIEYLTKDKCLELLKEEDRKEDAGVILWQKRLKLCKRNNERTKEIKFDDMLDMALRLYEKKQITYDKLKYILSLSNCTPEEFNIREEKIILPSEEEILKILEEE